MMFTSTFLMAKTLGMALLARANMSYLGLYLVLDMGMYLLYKFARRDFSYWLPVKSNFANFMISMIARVVIKLLADFTSLPHLHHPYDLGGMYYSFNLMMAFVSCWVSAYIYLNSTLIEEANKLSSDSLYGALGLLTSVAVVSFGAFILTIKREYVHTFFSPQSGSALSQRSFRYGETDEEKAQIFGFNTRQWQAIEPKVREWVNDNYHRWVAEEEVWFTEAVAASIPEDMKPSGAR
jgi:hypothetical protein